MTTTEGLRAPWRTARCVFALAVVALALAPEAGAEESTLERIARTGAIRLGYGDSRPFSYVADDQVVGYSIDLCRHVAEVLRQRLNLARLEVGFVPRPPSRRIPMLDAGEYDLDCAASSNIPERRPFAAFAPPHFFSSTRYVARAASGFRTLEDLKGRSVSVTSGSINVAVVTRANRERRLNLAVVAVDSVAAAFGLVADGKVAAFAIDEALLAGLVNAAATPAEFAISEEAFDAPTPYGIMSRIGDPEFAAAVADILSRFYRSPQMRELYDRWFTQPIPGGVTMHMPMSPALAEALGAVR